VTEQGKALAFEQVEVENRGFMFEQPTNAVIAGTNEVVIIDPGYENGVELIEAALAKRGDVTVKAILLTHGHPDHINAAPGLKQMYHAPILLHPTERQVASRFMDVSAIDSELHGGMTISVDGGSLQVIDTPGHSPGHVVFYDPVSRTMIGGDLVSGNGTTGIFPPLGKMGEYLDSIRRMQAYNPRVVIPGHGPTMVDQPGLWDYYLERRLTREREIYDVLKRQPATIPDIVTELYTDILPHFVRAAQSTALAHLIKLEEEGRVAPESDDREHGLWRVTA
jgi:glyoxylase-like metal-dependent hydrolase (beta-lactamase superfamily II)